MLLRTWFHSAPVVYLVITVYLVQRIDEFKLGGWLHSDCLLVRYLPFEFCNPRRCHRIVYLAIHLIVIGLVPFMFHYS